MSMALDGEERSWLPRWTISWRLLFRVKNQTKALLRKIEEVRRAFDRDIEVSAIERYWKNHDLWECSLHVVGANGSAADIVFDCLVHAARLGNGWYILGLGGDGGLQSFSGVFDGHRTGTPCIMGLEWGSFDLVPRELIPDLAVHWTSPSGHGTNSFGRIG
jgi:hypothetical protein